MNADAEDEKKPFANAEPEDIQEPDPDEQLMLDQGHGRVWLVKIPKDILARWTAINKEDVHLATMRVYQDASPGGKPRIVLFLPPYKDKDSGNGSGSGEEEQKNAKWPSFGANALRVPTDAEPDCYELDMLNDAVDNQIVVAERPKDASFGLSSSTTPAGQSSRARTTILTGRIKHDCALRPGFSANYRKQMRERHRKYNTPMRQIQMIEQAGISGGAGGIKRLTSAVGAGAGNAFSDLVRTKAKPAKGTFERMARMPRNQLLDLIFSVFKDTPRWGIKTLRERTQQPEAYLKEVLSEVAFLHRSGEHNGLWELKDTFKDEGMKAEALIGPSGLSQDSDVKMETQGDEFDDEDEDEDMEEVS